MSTPKAQRVLLQRLGESATALLSVHLDLAERPPWVDGQDAEGRAVVLVGVHALGTTADAQAARTAVIGSLRAGEVPAGVHAVAYAPAAAAALVEIVAGASAEVLVHGARARRR